MLIAYLVCAALLAGLIYHDSIYPRASLGMRSRTALWSLAAGALWPLAAVGAGVLALRGHGPDPIRSLRPRAPIRVSGHVGIIERDGRTSTITCFHCGIRVSRIHDLAAQQCQSATIHHRQED